MPDQAVDDLDFIRSLRAGDHVLAGAGMRAELRAAFVDFLTTPDALVRWLNPADDHPDGWWGYHHSRVPWHTIRPVA
jgi:hypothetical protein